MGAGLADQAGLALRGILESVSRSSQLMAEIASSTATQSRASAEVMRTVADMNASADQVTTAVREQAAGSKRIRDAMENINKIMSQAAYRDGLSTLSGHAATVVGSRTTTARRTTPKATPPRTLR